eukprot:1827252-Pleurochrysis_carterae.AAC.1
MTRVRSHLNPCRNSHATPGPYADAIPNSNLPPNLRLTNLTILRQPARRPSCLLALLPIHLYPPCSFYPSYPSCPSCPSCPFHPSYTRPTNRCYQIDSEISGYPTCPI